MKNQKGFSLIELLIVVVIIGIIAAIAIPNLLAARRSSNEASAIATMRTVTSAEATYQSSVGATQFGDYTALYTAGLLDESVGATNGKSGYKFTVTANPSTGVTPSSFNAKAEPVQYGTGVSGTGSRSFGTSEAGVIYYSASGTAPTFDNISRAVSGADGPINN